MGNFENSANNVKNNVSQILSTQQNISPVAKGNVFDDPRATQKQIEAGIVRVQSATGGNVGDAEGLAATISVTDQLPGAVKNVVDDLKKSGKEITGGQFADKITSEITGFDKIPDFIQDKLKEQLEQTFQGVSRQGTEKGGVETVERFAQEGGIEKLSEISNKTRETFAKLNATVTKFDALILDSANLQVQSTRQLVDAQLKAADKTNAFADRLDKFRGGTRKDPLAQATQRLDQKVSILLNKGNVQTNDGGDLLKRRSQLEGDISFLKGAIGQTTGTDKFDTASLAAFDDPQTKALISELANTTSALEGTKQAIDLLANDTTELAAVEGKLASINESRLTGRQRLTALFSQLANAKNPFDRKKILDEFQRPLVAAAKAQQGIPLSFQEFAALQGDVLKGVNGLLGTVEKNLFGRSDEDILGRFETLLVNNQQTGISALQALGLTAAPAVFGGAAATAQGQTPQEQKLLGTADALLKRSVDLVNGVAQANADAIAGQQQILQDELTKTKDVLGQLNREFKILRNTILTLNPPDAAPFPAATPPPVEAAKGGVVYRANGGAASPFDQFKKGTDTVPAMLTDGEFVVQKSAVDRIGVGNLNMLNNLSGPKRDRVLYAKDGGLVGSIAGGSFDRVGSGDIFISSTNKQLEILAKNLIAANNAYKESSSSVEELTQKQKNLASAQASFENELGKGGFIDKFSRAVRGESNLDRIKRDVEGTGISALDLERVGLVGQAEVAVDKAERRRQQERQAQTNEAAIRNRSKTGLGAGLFGSGTQERVFVTGRTKEQFENQNRGISGSNLKSNLADATQLSKLNRGVSAIGFTRGKELQSELQQKAGGSGLGALVPKTGDLVAGKKLGGVAQDPQRLTDRQRSDERNRFTLKDLDKFEDDLFGKQDLQKDFGKRITNDIGGIANSILSPADSFIGFLNNLEPTQSGKQTGSLNIPDFGTDKYRKGQNFDTRQQKLREEGLREAILPEENDILLRGAIQGLENLKSNIETANLSAQLLPDQQRATGNINADEGVLGKIDEKLKVLRLFEKDLKPRQSLDPEVREQADVESKARASDSLGKGIKSDAKRLGELGDDTVVDRAEKEYRKAQQKYQTALKDTITAGGDLAKGSGDNVTELGKLFQERQDAFDNFKKAQKIQTKPTTPNESRSAAQTAAAKPAQAAAKQQTAKDTKRLPQTAGGNAFVPDVDEQGQAISSTELTPEEQKIVTRYLQDKEKETGKTAGKLGLRGKNDLGDLGVSADGSKDAAIDKFVLDRNLGAGGVDGKGFRKGSQPDPAKLAERDAAVLGTTTKDTTSPDKFPIAGESGGTAFPQSTQQDAQRLNLSQTQRLRATRRTSNRRGYVPQRGFYAQRAINARQQRYAQSGAPGLGSSREDRVKDFYQNAIQNGGQESLGPQNAPQQTGPNYNQRSPSSPSARPAAPTAGAMQIQGAAELNQSLTQMTTVSQQLLAAATKLENLPALEITINGKIAPVEVVLNGTQMLTQFKEEFMNTVKDEIALAIQNSKTEMS